jgi:hypothetical protein
MIPVTAQKHIVFFPERLDFDVHARRQIEASSASTVCGVGSKMISRLCAVARTARATSVDVRRAEHRPLVLLGRQRDRTREPRARAPRRVHDLGVD